MAGFGQAGANVRRNLNFMKWNRASKQPHYYWEKVLDPNPGTNLHKWVKREFSGAHAVEFTKLSEEVKKGRDRGGRSWDDSGKGLGEKM
jgi:hypothetical protein